MNALELMLAELESNTLQVVLVPCKRPSNTDGCIRVAVSRNAHWYRRFCAAYPSSRIRLNRCFDTLIKRKATLATLERLLATGVSRSKYAPHLLRIARSLTPVEAVA